MKSHITLLFFVILAFAKAYSQNFLDQAGNYTPVWQVQPADSLDLMSFQEYLAFVKQHHPVMKQANLQLNMGEANLLKARGAFDPKIEAIKDRKKFKNTEYYDEFYAAFKIPTWYGIELKGTFEQNTGTFLDPSLTVPDDGLYGAGVSFSLAQGLLINERMADLRRAKFFINQTKAERDLILNDLIFEASKAYFRWLQASNERLIYENFLENAEIRFQGIKRQVEVGDKAAIDSVEAKIAFQNRVLLLEAAKLKQQKARLEASNFLWIDNVPVELREDLRPDVPQREMIAASLQLEGITVSTDSLDQHPKIRSIDAKLNGLQVDRRLKQNKLLPKINLEYNFLTPDGGELNSFNTSNYKFGLNASFPLFLRKERGDLRLASIKIQDTELERAATQLELRNKIEAVSVEITSLDEQNRLINEIVSNYQVMLNGELRMFQIGESSVFLINTREQKLIEATLKANELLIKSYNATASLYNALGIVE